MSEARGVSVRTCFLILLFIQAVERLTLPPSLHAQGVATWRARDTALFVIGGSPTDSIDQLDRVSAALWLGRSGLAIANHGDEIRFYDVQGRYRATTGRSGDGPGEFRFISWLGLGPDSTVFAYDVRHRRASMIDRHGSFLKSLRLESRELGTSPIVAGVFADGSLLTLWNMPPVPISAGGLSKSRLRLAVYPTARGKPDAIGDGWGTEAFLLAVPGRGYALRRAPFSPTPRHAAHSDLVYETDGVSYYVRIRDKQGRAIGLAGDSTRRLRITEQVKSAFLRDTLETWPANERARIEDALRGMMVHEFYPVVADMRVDDVGNVWLRRRDPTGPASHWDVFSPGGLAVAQVELPAHRTILDIRQGVVVLLQSGPYDEDLVRVYSLQRGAR